MHYRAVATLLQDCGFRVNVAEGSGRVYLPINIGPARVLRVGLDVNGAMQIQILRIADGEDWVKAIRTPTTLATVATDVVRIVGDLLATEAKAARKRG
jgi:hypothetical protein